MSRKNMSRRRLLKLLGLGVAGTTLAACQPEVVEKEVEKVVTQEVEKVVKEEVEVEKEVTRVVEKEVEEAEKPEVPIRYMTFWPGYRVRILEQALDIFKEQKPHINVQVEPLGADFRDKLLVTLAGGEAADTFVHDIWKMCRYVNEGLILDLTGYIDVDGIDLEEEYYLFGTTIWSDEKVYSFPFQCGPRSYYYNKYVLEEAGVPDPWEELEGHWSLTDLREWSKKCTMDTDGDGETDIYGLLWGVHQGTQYRWGSHVASYGARFADREAGRYTLDEPETIEAFKMIYDMYMEDKSILPPQEQTSLEEAGISYPHASGIVAFWEDTAGRLGVNRLHNKGEWDLLPQPTRDRDTVGLGVQSASPSGVWAESSHPDEAYEVVKFLGGDVMQTLMGTNQLIMPQLRSAADDPNGFLRTPPEHIHVMQDAMERFVPYFLHYNTLDTFPLIEEEMELAFLGEKPLEEALKDANRKANETVAVGDIKPRRPAGFVEI